MRIYTYRWCKETCIAFATARNPWVAAPLRWQVDGLLQIACNRLSVSSIHPWGAEGHSSLRFVHPLASIDACTSRDWPSAHLDLLGQVAIINTW